MRKKLDEYYAGPGSGDGVRIELPKGAYVPEIVETVAPAPAAAASGPKSWWKFAVPILLLFAVSAAVYFWPRAAIGSTVAVIPARWIWNGNDIPDIRHDEDLAERIAANLAARGGVQVVAWPSIQRFRESGATTNQISRQLGATRMIIVAVRVEADGFRVTAYMIDPKLDRKLMVSDRRSFALDTPANREKAAAELAASFVGPLGGLIK